VKIKLAKQTSGALAFAAALDCKKNPKLDNPVACTAIVENVLFSYLCRWKAS
jgi:hypothetical protein